MGCSNEFCIAVQALVACLDMKMFPLNLLFRTGNLCPTMAILSEKPKSEKQTLPNA